MTDRLWRWPISQSLGSWAGVTLRKPVAYSAMGLSRSPGITTCSSVMIGTMRLTIGNLTFLPTMPAARGSFGFIATAVSPSMVSGRVVATVT